MRATAGVAMAAGSALVAWLGWLAWTGALTHSSDHTSAAATRTPLGYPWRGAVHVHTDLSADATGSLEDVVAAAAATGLDYVLISDHTQAQGSAGRVHQGWHDDVLVVVGEEISTDEGHLLALDLRAHPYALGPTFRQAARDVVELGGALMVAHPVGGETPWRGGYAGVSGQEIVSLSTALQAAGFGTRLGALLVYPVNPEVAALRLLRRRPPSIDLWDGRTALGAPRPVTAVGIGAADAHGPVLLGVPSYAAAFRAVNTVVWMDEPPGSGERGAARRLAARLLEGRVATLLAAAGAAPELSFLARRGDGSEALPGQMRRFDGATWRLEASVGATAGTSIDLLRDGRAVATGTAGVLEHVAETPGTYRVDVYRTDGVVGGGRPGATPWIVTNPIYLWPEPRAGIPAARPAPELPAPTTGRSLLPLTGWVAESGGEAMSALGALDEGLRWDLRLPTAPSAATYATSAFSGWTSTAPS